VRITARSAALILPVPLGIALSAAMLWQASHLAPAVVDSGGPNRWASTIGLTNDATAPMFAASNLTPGQGSTRCLAVAADGTGPAEVRFYTTAGTAPTRDISRYITLTIERGTGGSFATCAGFTLTAAVFTGTLSTLSRTAVNYATGLPAGGLTGAGPPEYLSYRITWTLSPRTPNSAQGGSTPETTFTWEARTR
jgi:hypothetical protein